MKMNLKLLLALACLGVLLSGCATPIGTFDNRLTCSLARDKAYVASLYGPVGITAEIAAADAAVVCKP